MNNSDRRAAILALGEETGQREAAQHMADKTEISVEVARAILMKKAPASTVVEDKRDERRGNDPTGLAQAFGLPGLRSTSGQKVVEEAASVERNTHTKADGDQDGKETLALARNFGLPGVRSTCHD